MIMPPLFWGFIVSPLWGAMYMLSGSLIATFGVPWGYLIEGLAMLSATTLIARIDVGTRRPGMPSLGWQGAAPMLFAAMLLAGLGAAILGSEIDNIVRDRLPLLIPAAPIPPSEGATVARTIEPGPPLFLALTYGLVVPFSLAVVGYGIVLRNLLAGLPVWFAMGFGALATVWWRHEHPAYWLPWALSAALGAWVYTRSHSVWMGVAALLPQHAVIWLTISGVSPGIPGFDTDPKAVVEFQPVWFDAVGVLCLAVGGFLLIRGFNSGPPAVAAPPVAPTPPAAD